MRSARCLGVVIGMLPALAGARWLSADEVTIDADPMIAPVPPPPTVVPDPMRAAEYKAAFSEAQAQKSAGF